MCTTKSHADIKTLIDHKFIAVKITSKEWLSWNYFPSNFGQLPVEPRSNQGMKEIRNPIKKAKNPCFDQEIQDFKIFQDST